MDGSIEKNPEKLWLEKSAFAVVRVGAFTLPSREKIGNIRQSDVDPHFRRAVFVLQQVQ